ncbi:MAG: hypothetical protein RL385_5632 [Pseudomonadota bacterium]|jgi:uncharacterized protein (DUF2235 family)
MRDHPENQDQSSSGRNLVVSCDGTNNSWRPRGQRETNVVKLVRLCEKSERQCVYYDPGVGTGDTMPATNPIDSTWQSLMRAFGLGLGRGLYENVAEAYAFIAQAYRPGDRVFLFGFSRGAFTARSVSGLINAFGIVRPASLTLLPAMIHAYFLGKEGYLEKFGREVREHFADPAQPQGLIHFVGTWDTVESVGGVFSTKIRTTTSLQGKPSYVHVRHAVAAGEYRAAYAPRLYTGAPIPFTHVTARSFRQLAFPGAHSDVGGSYRETALSDAAFAWLVHEAVTCGLWLRAPVESQMDVRAKGAPHRKPTPQRLAHDSALEMPLWALLGLEQRVFEAVDVQPHEAADWEAALAGPRAWKNPWVLTMLLVLGTLGALGGTDLWAAPMALTQAGLHAAVSLTGVEHALARFSGPVGYLQAPAIAAYTLLLCVLQVYAVRGIRRVQPRAAHCADNTRAFHRGLRMVFKYTLWSIPLADLALVPLARVALGQHGVRAALGACGLSLASAVKVGALGALCVALLVCAVAGVWTRPSPR